MKQEDCGPLEYGVPESITDESCIPTPDPDPAPSRARTPKPPKTPRRSKKTKNPETPVQNVSLDGHVQSQSTPQGDNVVLPKKRGRPRGSTRANREAAMANKPTTKAGMAGTNDTEAYSYTDLFMADDEQDVDENVDVGDEDSEYAPSDEELVRRISTASRKRRGVSAGTRRQSRNKSFQDELDEGGSTDEDEAGESESEDDDEEEEEYGDITGLQDSMENGAPIPLFEDEQNQVQRDIYDFDAQSIISDKRTNTIKKRMSAQTANRTSGTTGSRPGRRTRHGRSTSWGSNIYSALAASLKTRADLDAYSNFLKCNFLNTAFDQFLAKICKPSNQHAHLFYGASASLQSLMSRINDHDKVVELLHAFVSRPYEQLQHRVVYLVPIIHQPIFGTGNVTSFNQMFDSFAKSFDAELVIKPAYILDPDTSLLAIPGSIISDFGLSIGQYNCITNTGNMGRYMPDNKHLIVPTDVYQKLNEMVALPPERVYEVALARAHQQGDEADIDISPLEPPNLQRIVMAVSSDGTLLGIAVLDTWNRAETTLNLPDPVFNLINPSESSGIGVSSEVRNVPNDLTIEEQVKEVLDNVIDWVVLKSDPKNLQSLPKRNTRGGNSVLGQIHFIDAFLVRPNGRRDTLLLVANQSLSHPPLDDSVLSGDVMRVFCLNDESRFALEKHGFTPDMPISLDGVHSVDPDEAIEEKALLVVPDLLFDTLRKVMLRELVSSTGTAAAAAVVTSSTLGSSNLSVSASGTAAMIRCTKFVILDQQRRVPLAIAFDSPVRLALHIKDDQLGVHPIGIAASEYFDQVTPADLKACELSFKPTTAEYRLVSINGLLFGLQIDDKQIIRRVLEIVPARFGSVYPHVDHPNVCAQSILATHQSCPSNVRIINEETNSSTVLPAFYYPHQEQGKLTSTVNGFINCICKSVSNLPVTISLYDVVLRMAQKYMPEILARQHIEAAEAAAYAEASANPHAPPPEPVPLPEHWGVCCLCAKELRSVNGLLDHEMRHVGLLRFRCAFHNISFMDSRSWQMHTSEAHASSRPALPSSLPRLSTVTQTDSGSEHEEDEDEIDQDGIPGSSLMAGLANVFNTNLLLGRMEAPQCEKCSDNFPAAEILAQHLDFCDGVSFSVRTPIPRAASNKTAVDSTVVTETNEEQVPKEDSFICGLCGIQVSTREKLLRHFTAYHLQCIICNKVLRSVEELSCHYHGHLKSEATDLGQESLNADVSQTNEPSEISKAEVKDDTGASKPGGIPKTILAKLMACDICADFYGTKYNYYFHQWTDHGVVHPPVGSVDGTQSQVLQHARNLKKGMEKDDMFAPVSAIRKIKCKLCDAIVRVAGKDYVLHLSKEHGVIANPDVICRICAELFETPDDLSAHLGECHAPTGEYTNAGVQTIYRCSHCDFWGFSHSLIQHSREVHMDTNPSIYECVHCYERFSDKRSWRTHLDKHTEGYSHRCLDCGRAFRLRPSLLHHIKTHHSDDQGPATCEYCGLAYPKRAALRYHVYRMHNQELSHECLMCQRRFRLETELRRHVKEMHSGAVKCEICHKVCSNLRCYAQHRQKHFRTRIYQCTDCQTTFKSKHAMKRHIRVEHLQLGPEKFECQICGKIVTQIGMHMLIHKEARFECEYCNKRFTKAAYYNEHLRIHRGEQPFECHICRKRFNKKSNLNVHLRFHEKHRDEEGNYLELKPRGRISTMFGDANMSPSERAARQIAVRAAQNSMFVPRIDACVGSDLPGAFNCTGPAGAASEAASRVAAVYGINEADENHMDNGKSFSSYDNIKIGHMEPAMKRQRYQVEMDEGHYNKAYRTSSQQWEVLDRCFVRSGTHQQYTPSNPNWGPKLDPNPRFSTPASEISDPHDDQFSTD